MWSWKRDGFSLHVRSRGSRLRSGRRSKTKCSSAFRSLGPTTRGASHQNRRMKARRC
jgi:hypothetical protein